MGGDAAASAAESKGLDEVTLALMEVANSGQSRYEFEWAEELLFEMFSLGISFVRGDDFSLEYRSRPWPDLRKMLRQRLQEVSFFFFLFLFLLLLLRDLLSADSIRLAH